MKYLKIFTDFAEVMGQLSDAEKGRLFTAMIVYADCGEEPKLTGNERILWPQAKLNIDNQKDSYDKMCEVNRQNISKRYEAYQESTDRNESKDKSTDRYERLRTATKTYGSKQDKDKDKDKDNINNIYSPAAADIINYLNSKAGTKFKTKNQLANKKIAARLHEGYSVDDFKKVIDNKCDEWLESDMAKYLRPETLFGSKFDSYLNQPPQQAEYDNRKQFIFNKSSPKKVNRDEPYRAFFESAFKP